MTSDSDRMPLDPLSRVSRKRLNYDPTINLGHILTFVGFLATGSVAYFDLRERIALGELRDAAIAAQVESEKGRLREALQDIRDDMREVRRGVEDLGRNSQRFGK